MAKPKKERATDHPIGKKINLILARKGLVGDYAALAAEFGVAVTSVYGWVEKGRIAKSRLTKLSEWSGEPLKWWLSDATTLPSHGDLGVVDQLQDWRLMASEKSQEVIDQLTMLARRNKLARIMPMTA